MICPTCTAAADARAPRDQHCADPKCMCGHRVERYADPAPLQHLAAEALTAVRHDPRADDPAYNPITGYRTWDEVEADPPQFTGILAVFEQQAAETDTHAAAVEAAIARLEAEPDDRTITFPRIDDGQHPYQQVPSVGVRVCACGLWPDHHIHTGDRTLCSCMACRTNTTRERCRAEYHHPTMQSARCDLPAGHADLHREQPDLRRIAFRWDDSAAMYPTSTTTED